VRDAAGSLEAGTGCDPVGPRQVRCVAAERPASHSVFVDAGDGADYVGAGVLPVGAVVELRAGRGADYVVGSDQADLLAGGRSSDSIAGRAGDDTIDGGTGSDAIDAGAGRDRLSYEDRRRRVRVDLRAATGGAEGERDQLAGIEEVLGGRAGDVLAGGTGPDRLLGGPGDGRDRVSGRGGDDVLVGHRARGGPGDDSIDARVAACGRGDDRLARISFRPKSPFPRACEAILAGAFLEIAPDPVRRTQAVAVYRLRCVAAIGRCAGRLELSDRRGLLGRARFSRPDASAADPTRVKIRLSRPPAERIGTLRLRAEPAYRRDRFKTRLR
jgi:hypothetical protein